MLLRDSTLEHANEIEEQLAVKIEQVEALVVELELRNAFIRQVFGRHVTDEVVNTLLASPEGRQLGGERRTLTILISDLRGFSTLCEGLGPEQVVAILNIYLGAMADVIGEYRGSINEFIGDAILAVFGAPVPQEDHPERAVACAIAMQRADGPRQRRPGRARPARARDGHRRPHRRGRGRQHRLQPARQVRRGRPPRQPHLADRELHRSAARS